MLLDAVRAPGAGASLAATKHQSFILVEPLTVAGERWLRNYANQESTWEGSALVVEPRYFGLLAETAVEAGMIFERDALPN